MRIENGILISIDSNDINEKGQCFVPFGVTAIGKSAFRYSDVKSVIIPNSVTCINEEAFLCCNSLTEITIPSSITKIEKFAFAECDLLSAVYISDLTSWCNIDFHVSLGNPLYFARDLYLNGELIKKLVIPDNVTTIKNSSFEGGSFKEIIIPDSVTSIEKYAFSSCDYIESITIPNNIEKIGYHSFDNCCSLSRVNIKGELKFIDRDAFEDSTNLKEIHVCSEKLKSKLETQSIPKNCKIIVDKTLNKDKSKMTQWFDVLNDKFHSIITDNYLDTETHQSKDR